MHKDAAVVLRFRVDGKGGKGSLSALLPGGDCHTDLIDIRDAKARARIATALVKGRNGVDRKTVVAELERLAAEHLNGPEKPCRSQADALAELAQDADLFRTPGGHDSEA